MRRIGLLLLFVCFGPRVLAQGLYSVSVGTGLSTTEMDLGTITGTLRLPVLVVALDKAIAYKHAVAMMTTLTYDTETLDTGIRYDSEWVIGQVLYKYYLFGGAYSGHVNGDGLQQKMSDFGLYLAAGVGVNTVFAGKRQDQTFAIKTVKRTLTLPVELGVRVGLIDNFCVLFFGNYAKGQTPVENTNLTLALSLLGFL